MVQSVPDGFRFGYVRHDVIEIVLSSRWPIKVSGCDSLRFENLSQTVLRNYDKTSRIVPRKLINILASTLHRFVIQSSTIGRQARSCSPAFSAVS